MIRSPCIESNKFMIYTIISGMKTSLEICLGQVLMESESKHIYVLPIPKGLGDIRHCFKYSNGLETDEECYF